MKTDSDTTTAQKAHVREQARVAYGVDLPDWYVDGAYLSDMRRLVTLLKFAHERLMAAGIVPTKDAGVLSCPICQGTRFRDAGRGWLQCADNECGGEVKITIEMGEPR